MTLMSNVASIADQGKKKNATNVRLGRNARYIMGERGISQVQMAVELGLTESQVSRRLSGSVDWTPEDIEKAARLLRVGIERLFTLPLPEVDSNHQPAGSSLRLVTSVADDRHRPAQRTLDHTAEVLQFPTRTHTVEAS